MTDVTVGVTVIYAHPEGGAGEGRAGGAEKGRRREVMTRVAYRPTEGFRTKRPKACWKKDETP